MTNSSLISLLFLRKKNFFNPLNFLSICYLLSSLYFFLNITGKTYNISDSTRARPVLVLILFIITLREIIRLIFDLIKKWQV